MSDGWEITTKAKTKYVLEWEESYKQYDQRDGEYQAKRKVIKDFVSFQELYEYYLKNQNNKNIGNVIGYKMEWLDLDKKIKQPGYRGTGALHED